MEENEPVRLVARESDADRGEDWSLMCGATGPDADTMCVIHLAHLVVPVDR